MIYVSLVSHGVCPAIRISGSGIMIRTKDHPQTTFGALRSTGVRGVLVCCSDDKCSHVVAMDTDTWPDTLRLSDIEDRFVCQVCGERGADVRPDFPRAKMDTHRTGTYVKFT
jgi:hypothetical protein